MVIILGLLLWMHAGVAEQMERLRAHQTQGFFATVGATPQGAVAHYNVQEWEEKQLLMVAVGVLSQGSFKLQQGLFGRSEKTSFQRVQDNKQIFKSIFTPILGRWYRKFPVKRLIKLYGVVCRDNAALDSALRSTQMPLFLDWHRALEKKSVPALLSTVSDFSFSYEVSKSVQCFWRYLWGLSCEAFEKRSPKGEWSADKVTAEALACWKNLGGATEEQWWQAVAPYLLKWRTCVFAGTWAAVTGEPNGALEQFLEQLNAPYVDSVLARQWPPEDKPQIRKCLEALFWFGCGVACQWTEPEARRLWEHVGSEETFVLVKKFRPLCLRLFLDRRGMFEVEYEMEDQRAALCEKLAFLWCVSEKMHKAWPDYEIPFLDGAIHRVEPIVLASYRVLLECEGRERCGFACWGGRLDVATCETEAVWPVVWQVLREGGLMQTGMRCMKNPLNTVTPRDTENIAVVLEMLLCRKEINVDAGTFIAARMVKCFSELGCGQDTIGVWTQRHAVAEVYVQYLKGVWACNVVRQTDEKDAEGVLIGAQKLVPHLNALWWKGVWTEVVCVGREDASCYMSVQKNLDALLVQKGSAWMTYLDEVVQAVHNAAFGQVRLDFDVLYQCERLGIKKHTVSVQEVDHMVQKWQLWTKDTRFCPEAKLKVAMDTLVNLWLVERNVRGKHASVQHSYVKNAVALMRERGIQNRLQEWRASVECVSDEVKQEVWVVVERGSFKKRSGSVWDALVCQRARMCGEKGEQALLQDLKTVAKYRRQQERQEATCRQIHIAARKDEGQVPTLRELVLGFYYHEVKEKGGEEGDLLRFLVSPHKAYGRCLNDGRLSAPWANLMARMLKSL